MAHGVHRVKWHHSNLWSLLWGNMAHCVKFSGEDLSRYSNKIESVGLTECLYYHYLAKKVMSQCKHLQSLPNITANKTAGIHMVWRNCHCHLCVCYEQNSQDVQYDCQFAGRAFIAKPRTYWSTAGSWLITSDFLVMKIIFRWFVFYFISVI